MEARTFLSTCVLMAAWACTTTGEDKPIECEPKNTKIDWEPCNAEERLAYDTVSSLGFSPNDVLDNIVGTYEFPIAWFDPCDSDAPCAISMFCDAAPERSVSRFAGTVTVLSIELQATGDQAIAETPGPEPWQVCCPTNMWIPARLALRTTDGAMDAVLDVGIGSEHGDGASVGIDGPPSIIGGALAEELPDDATVLFELGTFDDRVSLSIHFLPAAWGQGNDPVPPLLQEEIRSDERCPPDVPIEDVLRTSR